MYMSKSASITRFRMGRKEKRGGRNAVCGSFRLYGTKRDLPACLESLRTQSLRDAEFLLVDDASPDGASAVLAEYARRDSRFRVLTHSQNRGLFAARMTGADAGDGQVPRFSGQRRF